jgi:hypothetical protein
VFSPNLTHYLTFDGSL